MRNGRFKSNDGCIGESELRHFISGEMIRVGFDPSLKGFRYFCELLYLSILNRSTDNLIDMYKQAADKLSINWKALERNLRTLVYSSFYNGTKFIHVYEYFGLPPEDRAPTVRRILALMSEYIVYNLFENDISFIKSDKLNADDDD